METLWKTAQKSLEHNTVSSIEGALTVAGGHQFKTFWVRDFCYAVPGLMALGHNEQVKHQLSLCLKYQRNDGLIARGFDVINPKLRVVAETFGIQKWINGDYTAEPLKTEYLGEHGTPAVDSNLLVLLTCMLWMEKNNSTYFWDHYSSQLEKAFVFTLSARVNHLLTQPAFSDWQDSARREGSTFYLNILFYRVLLRLQKQNITWSLSENLEAWKKNIWSAFYDSKVGLFKSQLGREQFSLETQLWCIEEDLFSSLIPSLQLWKNLKASPLWGKMPGRPVWPDYPAKDVSWTTKLVGLRHYHDQFYWSWLMGESLKIAKLMNDIEANDLISGELQRLANAHGTIHEVYEMSDKLTPVERALYKSERPFSWGAGKIIEALAKN